MHIVHIKTFIKCKKIYVAQKYHFAIISVKMADWCSIQKVKGDKCFKVGVLNEFIQNPIKKFQSKFEFKFQNCSKCK